MSKRLVVRSEHLKAWHMQTLEGRVVTVIYDTTHHDTDDAAKIAYRLIPRGWKAAHDRPHRIQPGHYELPLRRATRGIGR